MPGNYNKGDEYTVDEQVPFATFVACRLDTAGNPFAINAAKHFYDREHHICGGPIEPRCLRWCCIRIVSRDSRTRVRRNLLDKVCPFAAGSFYRRYDRWACPTRSGPITLGGGDAPRWAWAGYR